MYSNTTNRFGLSLVQNLGCRVPSCVSSRWWRCETRHSSAFAIFFKLFVAFLVLITCQSSLVMGQGSSVNHHASVDGRFAVQFPVPPNGKSLTVMKSGLDGEFTEEFIQCDDWKFSVEYSLSPQRQALDSRSREQELAKRFDIVSSKQEANREPFLESYSFVLKKDGLTALMQVHITASGEYRLVIAERQKAKSVNYSKEERQRFLDSFRLLALHPVEGEAYRGNLLGLEMQWIPPGSFRMGSPHTETGRNSGEAQVDVTFSSGFWLGKTELTQEQWMKLPATAAFVGKKQNGIGPRFPAYGMKDSEAIEFCELLTEYERAAGHIDGQWTYTLPTEAQWEYACRGGSSAIFYFGNDPKKLPENAWFSENSNRMVHEVARKKPNPFGLYDICGNLNEFCLDLTGYADAMPGGTDPLVTSKAAFLMSRGGSFESEMVHCRSASRTNSGYVGMRIALVRTSTLSGLAPRQMVRTNNNQRHLDIIRQQMTSVSPLVVKSTERPANIAAESNRLGIEMIWCEPGIFLMGSPIGHPAHQPTESPVLTGISNGFWMTTTEVTTEAVVRILELDVNAQEKLSKMPYRTHWARVNEFCRKLNENLEVQNVPKGYSFRLPTEAEWEYACKAGTNTQFFWGEQYENGNRYSYSPSQPKFESDGNLFGIGMPLPAPVEQGNRLTYVATYAPNPWGFTEIIGNAPEWCLDSFDKTLSGGWDPLCGYGDPSVRVVRGRSSWARDQRSIATPNVNRPTEFEGLPGFRVVLAKDVSNTSLPEFVRDTRIELSPDMLSELATAQFAEKFSYSAFQNNTIQTVFQIPIDVISESDIYLEAAFQEAMSTMPPSVSKRISLLTDISSLLKEERDAYRQVRLAAEREASRKIVSLIRSRLSREEFEKFSVGWMILFGPSESTLIKIGYSKDDSKKMSYLFKPLESGRVSGDDEIYDSGVGVADMIEACFDDELKRIWKLTAESTHPDLLAKIRQP